MFIAAVACVGIVLAIAYSCKATHHSTGVRERAIRGDNMKAVKSDGVGGVGITLTPRDGSYDGVVIFMHGLGDTADGWAQSSELLVTA
jgi:hypothetical protein